MKIKRLTKLCMAYYETWHTWHKQCHKHSTFLWLFSPMIPSSNFDYSGGSTNSSGNKSSSKTTSSSKQLKKICSFSSSSSERCAGDKFASKNNLSGKSNHHAEDQNTYFPPCKNPRKTKYGSCPQSCSSRKVFCKYASNFQKSAHEDLWFQ